VGSAAIYNKIRKGSLGTKLDRAIIKAIKVPVDLLLSSEEEIIWQQKLPGHIIRTALREGVAL